MGPGIIEVFIEYWPMFLKGALGTLRYAAIAVAGGKRDEPSRKCFSPCGVCRQVMAEFCAPDFKVILGEDEEHQFSELLPYTFDGEKIK